MSDLSRLGDFDLIDRCRADREHFLKANEVRAYHGEPAIAPTAADRLLWEVAERLQKALAERSALIGQRIVEDGAGRGWWAYVDAPEDEQGFPEPFLFSTYSDAEKAVLAAGEAPDGERP